MKITKKDRITSWMHLEIEDEDKKITIVKPKCRCMSCEDLYIEIEDEEGTRKYDVYCHYGNEKENDMNQLIMTLAEELSKRT